MCSLRTGVKPKINSITKQSNSDRAQELWNKLKLEHIKFFSSDSKLKNELFLYLLLISFERFPLGIAVGTSKKEKQQNTLGGRFHVLNSLTVDDSFPTPNISEVLETLGESRVFSTLDAQNEYHCISIEENQGC